MTDQHAETILCEQCHVYHLDHEPELRAEIERLTKAEFDRADQVAYYMNQAIEQTWRPEVIALRAENERLRTAGNALIDSCEMWNWLLENGGMLPNTGYMNMTVKLSAIWGLAQLLGRDKLP